MLTYVIRRLLYSIVVLFAASVIVFWGMSLVTSPIGFLRMQPGISEQTIHNIEKRKHLDRPIYVRYGYWMKDVVTNKFGTETINDTPIFPDLKRAMGHTLQLVVVAELLAILLAVGIGVYSALRQYSVFDYTATTASFVGLAIPVFWLALMLQVLFVNIYLWFDVRIFYVANLSGVDPGTASTSPSTVRSISVCRSSCSWWRASRSTLGSCAPRCSRSSMRTTCERRAPKASTSAKSR